jgi:hypothetical protein
MIADIHLEGVIDPSLLARIGMVVCMTIDPARTHLAVQLAVQAPPRTVTASELYTP